jgi:hypothetical protein
MMDVITVMWGTGDNVGRSARVLLGADGYLVEGYIGDKIVKQIPVEEYSCSKAENIADDWVWGLIKE